MIPVMPFAIKRTDIRRLNFINFVIGKGTLIKQFLFVLYIQFVLNAVAL